MSSFSRSIKRFLGFTRSPLQRAHRSKLTVEAFEDRITPTVIPFPATTAINPLGSLAYSSTVTDSIAGAGDTDDLTISLDINQKISVAFVPDATLQGSIQILDASSTVIGSGSAATPGAPILINNISVAALGTYTVHVSEIGGSSGNYTVQLGLNTQGEAEIAGTQTNNTPATAESIDGSFISTGASAGRSVVVGTTDVVPTPLYTVAAVTPTFTDISATGVVGITGDDVGTVLLPIDLGGFTFPLYGTTYSTIYYSTNGLISFGTAPFTSVANSNFSTTPAEAAIAPLWDDLNIIPADGGATYFQVDGVGPTQTLTIQWTNASHYVDPPAPSGPAFSFQVVLSANGEIQFNYGTLSVEPLNFSSSTVGIKAPGTSSPFRQLLNFNNTAPTYDPTLFGDNLSTRWTPPTPLVVTSPDVYSLTLAAGEKITTAISAATVPTFTINDASDTVLATAVAGATNVSRSVDFTAPAAGIYYLKVVGDNAGNVPYSIVTTKNAGFDLEVNDTIAQAVDITGKSGAIGYTATTTVPYTPTVVTPTFTSIIGGAGTVSSIQGDDVASASIPIGFNFPFYGVNQSSLFFTTNGVIAFATSATNLSTAYDPTPGMQSGPTASNWAAIAPFWDDLNLVAASGGRVYYQLAGSSPNQTFTVEWANARRFTSADTGVPLFSFQAVLSENGNVQFNYGANITTARITASTSGIKDAGSGAGVARVVLNDHAAAPNQFVDSNKSTLITAPFIAPNPDYYKIVLSSNQGGIVVSSSTPADGAGEFVNTLDPKLDLYDSAGVLVASGVAGGDGRNETLTASGLNPGQAYYVKVTPQGTTAGEYAISYTTTAATVTSTALVSSLNPAPLGNNVTFTATVTPAVGNAGTVTFFDGATAISSAVPVVGSVASFTISSLTASIHPITAVYSGGSGFGGSTSSVVNQSVVGTAPTTTTIVSGTPNPVSAAGSFDLLVNVTGGASAVGETVTITEGATTIATGVLVAGPGVSGTVTISILASTLSLPLAGSHSLVAHYAGNPSTGNLASDSVAYVQTVSLAATTTALTFGDHTPGAVTPAFENISATGAEIADLTAQDDAALLLTIGFNFPFYGTNYSDIWVGTNGVIGLGTPITTYDNADLNSSTSAIIAPYWDDLHISGTANSKIYQEVLDIGGPNQRIVIQWNDVSYFGGTRAGGVTFQAVLYATGVIQFNYLNMETTQPGGSPAGSSATVGIRGTSATPPPPVVQIDLDGTQPFGTLVGSNLSTRFDLGGPRQAADTTPIYLYVNTTGIADGETITLVDTNHGNAIIPFSGGPLASNQMLISILPTDIPALGAHLLQAQYAATATNAASNSALISQVIVNTVASTTTLTPITADPTTTAQPIVLTVAVSAPGGLPVTGETVQIFEGATVVGSGILNASGTADVTIAPGVLAPGAHTLFAHYNGNVQNLPSDSADLTRNVDISTTTLVLSAGSPNPAGLNQAITFNVTLTGGAPATGEIVTLYDADTTALVTTTGGVLNSSGVATITIPAGTLTTTGTYHFYAVYTATTNNSGSQSANVTEVVTGNVTTTVLVVPPSAVTPSFVDISSTGTVISALTGTDDGTSSVPIGFAFPFFGTAYTDVFVNVNGWLSFGSAVVSTGPDFVYQNTNFTTYPNQALIAAYWDDLYNAGTAATNIYTQVVGSGASQQLIVQWNDVSYFADATRIGGVTFQAILSADGTVQVNFLDLTTNGSASLTHDNGVSATVGIKPQGLASPSNVIADFNSSQPFGVLVGTGLSTQFTPGVPPKSIADSLSYAVTVTGATTDGDTVELRDASNANALVGTGVLAGGSATIAVAAGTLSIGTHNLYASYLANVNTTNLPNQSAPAISQVITGFASTTTIAPGTPNPATTAQPVSFVVTVDATGGDPTNGHLVHLIDLSNGGVTVPSTGGTLAGGTATLTVAAGVLSAGFHDIAAVYEGGGSNSGSTSTPVSQEITGPTAVAPTVSSVVVNGGAAYTAFAGVQRSMVVSMFVTFDQPVQLTYDGTAGSTTGAFQFAIHPNSYQSTPPSSNTGTLPAFTATSTDNINWVIEFVGTAPNGFDSIADGVYDFKVDTAFVSPLGVPSTTGTTAPITTFHRLFGDSTGDSNPAGPNHLTVVDSSDNGGPQGFRASFNTPANYRPYYDFNGDGVIETSDNLQFRNRFNRQLSWTT